MLIMSGRYAFTYIERCRKQNHCFQMVWSDKTPLKASLMCITCTLALAKNVYVAHGVDTASWGTWRRTRKEDEV